MGGFQLIPHNGKSVSIKPRFLLEKVRYLSFKRKILKRAVLSLRNLTEEFFPRVYLVRE
jgi:hypothetical protein